MIVYVERYNLILGHVLFIIIILTWLPGFLDKRLYLVLFSLYLSLGIKTEIKEALKVNYDFY